jgi:DNA-nicking Smr family endonuclease
MANNFLSDKDKALFRKAMDTVKPLPKSNKAKISLPKKDIPSVNSQTTKVPKTSSHPFSSKDESSELLIPCFQNEGSKEKIHYDYPLSDYYREEVQADTLLSFSQPSVPKKRLAELKNGKIPWQARLDLHGQNVDLARLSLIHFIEQQIALTRRCLLIIHGKGNHQGKIPILKNLVNCWLPQLPQVLAFHSALPRDGGSGALYVLLRRQR